MTTAKCPNCGGRRWMELVSFDAADGDVLPVTDDNERLWECWSCRKTYTVEFGVFPIKLKLAANELATVPAKRAL